MSIKVEAIKVYSKYHHPILDPMTFQGAINVATRNLCHHDYQPVFPTTSNIMVANDGNRQYWRCAACGAVEIKPPDGTPGPTGLSNLFPLGGN